jgi:hypothetical protein
MTDLTNLPLIFVKVGKNTTVVPLSIQESQELTLWHWSCAMAGLDTTASQKATKGRES